MGRMGWLRRTLAATALLAMTAVSHAADDDANAAASRLLAVARHVGFANTAA